MTQQIEEFLTDKAAWKKAIAPYQQPDLRRSLWQLANTLIPYTLLWVLMALAVRVSYWLTIPLIILTAGFMIRAFIIFHDCGHGAFFASRRANEIVGFITGLVVLTPYFSWRHGHALHHAASGDLDRRGPGDIWMMTVDEYRAASPWQRFGYRMYRTPIILLIVGPTLLFMLFQRFPNKYDRAKERRSVYLTNLAILLQAVVLSLLIGFKAYIILQTAVMALAATAGVWLFYVQHQYEGVYWERHNTWDYAMAAVIGSSFYKLPRILQWFTGNIGFHHIHHLSPRIPNYNLEACHEANPALQIKPLTFSESLRCLDYRLWDEANFKLINFREFRALSTPVTA